MSPQTDVRAALAPPLSGGAPGLIRWVCTKNPFYVLSAGLFLFGLRVSFGDQSQAEDTWALMSGLTAYTLLLAVTACLLVRFGNVWDDVRTVLLLVVLMFLATSVLFDEVLVLDPGRGSACFLGGFLFAVAVSEGILRGIRLALPAWFRLPYYLILGLFFLYPLAISPLLSRPRSEPVMWALFGFSTVAALVFLTLLPAVWRGPGYVRDNGSPWRWPLYPWTLFGLLAAAVPVRAFLLCWTLHLLDGAEDNERLIFGPYFLVPFGLAVAVLLLELGLSSGRRGAVWAALAAPVGVVALAAFGHHDHPVYRQFLETFTARLGGSPLYLTLFLVADFYGYAALRRVPLAVEALTAALALLAVVNPDAPGLGELVAPRPVPLLAAAALQLGLGLLRRSSWRCLLASAGLVALAALAVPDTGGAASPRVLVAFHLALLALLLVGAYFTDGLARFVRAAGCSLALSSCVSVLFARPELPPAWPSWSVQVYPLIMATLLGAYGWWLGYRPVRVIVGLILASWTVGVGWESYLILRRVVAGLDYLALSLTLFALAILISLGKSGALSRWFPPRQEDVSPVAVE